jgi:Methyltransferase domain
MATVLDINLNGDIHSEVAIRLQKSLDVAKNMQSKLPPEVLSMDGMSGKQYRSLINTLVESTPDARYLEIGSWAGSTACSAMFGNTCKVTCIDNWSQFGGPKDSFHASVNRYLTPNIDFNFIESDFRAVDFSSIGKFNIYMFDGPHDYEDQYDGIHLALPALDDTFLLIVDDWNWIRPREGTMSALSQLNLKVLTSLEIRTTDDDTDGVPIFQHSDWHNGYFIAHIAK